MFSRKGTSTFVIAAAIAVCHAGPVGTSSSSSAALSSCIASQPYGTELVVNGDFQSPTLSPWSNSNGSIGVGDDSSQGYQCHYGKNTIYKECYLSQNLTLCPGQTYKFQYYLKGLHSIQRSTGIAAGISDSTSSFGTLNNNQKTQWGIAGPYFYKHLNGSSPYVSFTMIDSESHIDNVSIIRVPQPSKQPLSSSVVQNPGFESGELAPWTQQPTLSRVYDQKWVVVSPGLNNSQYALLYNATAPSIDYQTYRSFTLYQTVPTVQYAAYLLSFDIQISSGPNTFQFTTSIDHDDEDENLQQFHYVTFGEGNHTYNVVLQADSGNQTTITVESEWNTGAGKTPKGQVLIDNFSMRKIASSKYYP